jgi:hypothetical protein
MINPYEHDESPIEDDDRFLCGCGDPRCWLVNTDDTNIQIKGVWFAEGCAGLCFFCREIDDLKKLERISGAWLAHPDCCKQHPVIAGELNLAARADEARDDFNERRR